MNFQPQLAEKVMAGEKTVTRRVCSENPRSPWYWERCGLVTGREYAVCPGRGKEAVGRVRITSVERCHALSLSDLTVEEVRREGFRSLSEFLGAFLRINAGRDMSLGVWRIEFETVPVRQSVA